MKIALVHDYLREYGGAERVVEAMHEMWPSAPLYTSFVDWPSFAKAPKGKVEVFKSMDIRTSWVQHVWLVKKLISPLRFLAPTIWGSFDLSGYDVVISSSGWFMCRGVALNNPTNPTNNPIRPIHISYIHHPPRNLYGYATGSDWQKYWPVRVYGAIINFFLRQYDYRAAQAVDYFIANSKETARRVKKFYRRESTVIYPPVDIKSKIQNPNDKQNPKSKSQNKTYFLSVGRLTYAKRVDLAIQAANKLKVPLKIVGTGKEEQYLRSIAGPMIEFVGSVTDEELSTLYAGAKALIFCALDEDFGMVAVEAQAQGTPVVALAQGGVLETVVDGKTGVLFQEPTDASLMAAIGKLKTLGKSEEVAKRCIAQAQTFSTERFKKELNAFVASHHV